MPILNERPVTLNKYPAIQSEYRSPGANTHVILNECPVILNSIQDRTLRSDVSGCAEPFVSSSQVVRDLADCG